MKQRNEPHLNRFSLRVTMFVAIAAIAVGAILTWQAFTQANHELTAEHDEHLLDIAWATDRNLNTILSNAESIMLHDISRNQALEEAYLGGDSASMLRYIRSVTRSEDGLLYATLLLKGDSVSLSSARTKTDGMDFPYGISHTAPCVCTDASGQSYLAIVTDSLYCDLSYVQVLDLQCLFELVAGGDLTENYWIVLYESDTGVMLQDNENEPSVSMVPTETSEERGDGISVILQAEKAGRIVTEKYYYEFKDRPAGDVILSAIPAQLSSNGVFSVGVGETGAASVNLVSKIFWSIAYSSVFVLIGIAILLAAVMNSRKMNKRMEKQAEALRQQNMGLQQLLSTVRELAHHQRLEMIGTMTSGIAHEFNNMLTPIVGYSLMTMEKLPEGCDELMDNLTEVYEAATRAKSLVSRLTALSRKNDASAFALFSPDTMLRRVLEMANPAKPESVTIAENFNCPEECLRGDEVQICQLFLNLVINAFQAMEDEPGTLTVATARNDVNVVFRISDTGHGIPDSAIAHIFEPFYTTKDLSRGTGLGLAIVSQIVQEHRGTIDVDSVIGKGTTFSVTLPLVPMTGGNSDEFR